MYPNPKSEAINNVYSRAVTEQQDSTPNLQGPIFKLVYLIQRLKLMEGAIKLLRRDADGRGVMLRLEDTELLAGRGGACLRYDDNRDDIPIGCSGYSKGVYGFRFRFLYRHAHPSTTAMTVIPALHA